MQVITDQTVRRELTPARAVGWIRDALAAAHAGDLISPPRVRAPLASGALVFTAGELRDRWIGYRSYTAPGSGDRDQLVTVADARTGRTRGVYVGTDLGPRRVGAIGAVAADALAPTALRRVAVLGSGVQAWHQLWALGAVRTPEAVAVYSRSSARRAAFAARVRHDLGLEAAPADSAREAVTGADLVIMATDSAVPVLDAGWVQPAACVSTLGPKQVHRHEFGLDLADRAACLVTDSVAQIEAYDPPNVLAASGTRPSYVDALVPLAGLLATGALPPAAEPGRDLSVFLSVGLAGTEAYLFARLLEELG